MRVDQPGSWAGCRTAMAWRPTPPAAKLAPAMHAVRRRWRKPGKWRTPGLRASNNDARAVKLGQGRSNQLAGDEGVDRQRRTDNVNTACVVAGRYPFLCVLNSGVANVEHIHWFKLAMAFFACLLVCSATIAAASPAGRTGSALHSRIPAAPRRLSATSHR